MTLLGQGVYAKTFSIEMQYFYMHRRKGSRILIVNKACCASANVLYYLPYGTVVGPVVQEKWLCRKICVTVVAAKKNDLVS